MIKHYLLLCFLLLGFSIQAQIKTASNSSAKGYNPSFFTHADVIGTSDLGSEQYAVTLSNRSELVGHFQYLASNSQIGDIMIDPNGGIYEIISGSFPTFTVQLLNDPSDLPEPYFDFPAAPTSPVNIARPIEPCGNLPDYAFLGAGIDSRLSVIVSNYNNNVLRDCAAMKGGSSGSYVRDTIIEPQNTKSLLDIVYYDAAGLVELADTSDFADGVVTEIIDADTYVVQAHGYFELDAPHSLTIGNYYIAEGAAGQIVTGQQRDVVHPILRITGANTGTINIQRPNVLPEASDTSIVVTDSLTVVGEGTVQNPIQTIKHPTSFRISPTTGLIEIVLADGTVLPFNPYSGTNVYPSISDALADANLATGAPFFVQTSTEGGNPDGKSGYEIMFKR